MTPLNWWILWLDLFTPPTPRPSAEVIEFDAYRQAKQAKRERMERALRRSA